jgi:hypothetical protein
LFISNAYELSITILPHLIPKTCSREIPFDNILSLPFSSSFRFQLSSKISDNFSIFEKSVSSSREVLNQSWKWRQILPKMKHLPIWKARLETLEEPPYRGRILFTFEDCFFRKELAEYEVSGQEIQVSVDTPELMC